VSRLHQAARGYAARGHAIFPLEPGRKTPLPGSRGHLEATSHMPQIERWWGHMPEANIGLVPASAGWLAFDIDSPEAAAMRTRWGLEAPALQVATAAGTHDYWRAPIDLPIPATWEGVIIRHAKGYVLLPPSLHPSGIRYRWAVKGRPATLPRPMLEAWAERADALARQAMPASVAPPDELVRRAEGFARRFAETPVGQRHAIAYRFAAFLRDLGADEGQALALLTEWNQRLPEPLSTRELERQCRYGLRARRRGLAA